MYNGFVCNQKGQIAKNNAKGMPADVNQYISQLMKSDPHPCTFGSYNVNNITIWELLSMISYKMSIHIITFYR